MHAYRDALDGVRSVRVLYPGTTPEYWPITAGGIDGVGAIPLRPGSVELRWIHRLVAAEA
jgi:predicted component of viral defense system (DUF524 family)